MKDPRSQAGSGRRHVKTRAATATPPLRRCGGGGVGVGGGGGGGDGDDGGGVGVGVCVVGRVVACPRARARARMSAERRDRGVCALAGQRLGGRRRLGGVRCGRGGTRRLRAAGRVGASAPRHADAARARLQELVQRRLNAQLVIGEVE